jgi:hypothetical protein
MRVLILVSVVALLSFGPVGFLHGQGRPDRSCTRSEFSETDPALLREAFHLQEHLITQ